MVSKFFSMKVLFILVSLSLAVNVGGLIPMDLCEMQCSLAGTKSNCCNTGSGNSSCCNTTVKCSDLYQDFTAPMETVTQKTQKTEISIPESENFIIIENQCGNNIKQFAYQHFKPSLQVNLPLLN